MKHDFVIPVFLRRAITALLSLLLIFMLSVTAHADPTDEPPGPTYTDGTVHLTATVPEGFGGKVSVQLSNVETGEIHTVSCFYSAGHETYAVLPLGTYFVERAFTSEDSFIYEAFTEYFEFTLGNFQELTVNVVYNEGAQEYLDDAAAQQGAVSQQPEQQGSAPQQGDTSSVPEDKLNDADDAEQPEDTPSEPAPDSTQGDTQNPEKKNGVLVYIGKVVAGTAVFAAIVFGVVFLVRKKMDQ